MRRIDSPVAVRLVEGRLTEIYWAKAAYAVEGLELLRIREGRWWLDSLHLRGTSRTYFRVLAASRGRRAVVMEIYRENNQYTLARMAD